MKQKKYTVLVSVGEELSNNWPDDHFWVHVTAGAKTTLRRVLEMAQLAASKTWNEDNDTKDAKPGHFALVAIMRGHVKILTTASTGV